ncbi:MAG TPA: high frequency lysogenization protein HflD [Halothiobacillus sp.]|nr:high frequency lysogenization protein HflD [Halothiobacillus sp.]
MNSIEDQTIALGGILQSCRLVRELAYHGKVENEAAFETCIRALFQFDPKDTADTFGGVAPLQYGLETFHKLLTAQNRQPADTELIRYAVSLIAVTKAFLADDAMSTKVHQRLSALAPSLATHGVDDALMTDLNQLYRESISTLSARIVVNGEKRFLEDPLVSSRIRALLLAGIRATVLWRQVGGNRWLLLLRRGQYLKTAHDLNVTSA